MSKAQGRRMFEDVGSEVVRALLEHRVVAACEGLELRGRRRADHYVFYCLGCGEDIGLEMPGAIPLPDDAPLPFFRR